MNGMGASPGPVTRDQAPLWLDVPFAEKEAAKAAGARWDPAARLWYASAPSEQVRRWIRVPDPLPGEDRQFGAGLFVDLIPQSCWFTNVRSCVAPADWHRLRKMVYRRAGQQCEICGSKVRLEAHERWAFDNATGTQRLVRLICLCRACHAATHFGLAQLQGRGEQARAHLMTVNSWTASQADDHIGAAFMLWRHRSRFAWELDLSILTLAGIELLHPPPAGPARREAAQRTLANELQRTRSTDAGR